MNLATRRDSAGTTLRVLMVHNRYQQAGGEDSVFANEVSLLRNGGCQVEVLEVSNRSISGVAAQIATALRVVSNSSGRLLMSDMLARTQPDIVHVHNFFPQLSPAVFDACQQAGVPAVWTLHNFRIACASGFLFRQGRVCEDCVGKVPLPAVLHRCYRGSTAGSAAVAAMVGWHRARGTWRTKVSRFIALNEFARDLFVRSGVPAERLAVKANFVADPRPEIGEFQGRREGAVFVGRLSAEKGASTLISAWRDLPHIPLTIVGDGPDRAALESTAPPWVRFVGFQDRANVLSIMARARALVVPSIWYENFPMTVVEAMALGTPVIASGLGALLTIVTNDYDGLHFAPGDPSDLARVVSKAFAAPGMLEQMGHAARQTWQEVMAPERNLEALLRIYDEARAA